MIKKSNLSTTQKISTKLLTKNVPLMNKLSTMCICCNEQNLASPEILKDVKIFFYKNKISFVLVRDKLLNWRLKARLAVRKNNNKLTLGLFYRNTHKIVSSKFCRAHHSLVTKIANIIEKKAREYSIAPYKEIICAGDLRYVQVLINDNKKTAQIAFVINSKKQNKRVNDFIKFFKNYNFIESIWVNYNVQSNNVIFSDNWEHIVKNKFIWQNFLGKNFAFHPAAFMQAHKQIFEKMLRFIDKKINKNSNVLELFAGVGVIGLSILSKCNQLTLVENNIFSKISFEATLKESFLEVSDKISYLNQDAALFDDFQNFEVIILDPPRKGLGNGLINKLSNLKNKTIIYISCNFTSFEKDVEELKKNRWQLVDAKCFLMFPGSNHVEIIGVLKKSG